VVAVGDMVCAPGSGTSPTTCRHGATARLARAIKPARVLALGDLQYEHGKLRAFRKAYARSWGTLKKITRPVPGNHEYHTAGAKGYFTYFGQAAPGYRAVKIGTWRVYLLNGNCGDIDCAKQRAWMRADMNAHPVACSAIALHFPRYSSGEHGSTASMARFWRIAYRHGADLALAGHDHDYERFVPMDGDGHRVGDGLTSFVVGTGGKSLYARSAVAPGSAYFRNDQFGVLVLRLGDGEFGWKFRTIGGAVRDAASASCH
jgi:hypothetical protein